MNSQSPERVTSVRDIYRGRIVSLKVRSVVLPSGRESTREIVEHPGAVVIVDAKSIASLLTFRETERSGAAAWRV